MGLVHLLIYQATTYNVHTHTQRETRERKKTYRRGMKKNRGLQVKKVETRSPKNVTSFSSRWNLTKTSGHLYIYNQPVKSLTPPPVCTVCSALYAADVSVCSLSLSPLQDTHKTKEQHYTRIQKERDHRGRKGGCIVSRTMCTQA